LTTSALRKLANEKLQLVGREFFAKLGESYKGLCVLKSRSPAACWPNNGKLAYCSIIEYYGPHTAEERNLKLIRLCVNCEPLPGLLYKIRNPLCTLPTTLQDYPFIELTAMPDEMPVFGVWIKPWLEAHDIGTNIPPEPPIPFGNDGNHRAADAWRLTDSSWRRFNYVWTKSALAIPIE